MMASEQHFYVSTAEQRTLVSILRRIPELVEELAITTSRQDRVARGGVKVRNGSGEQPLPVHTGAASAAHELRNELATWARLVCESRGIDYEGTDSILGLARWLDTHVVALAMTEGSEEALDSIRVAVGRCWRVIDLPEDDNTWACPTKVCEAHDKRVTAIEAQRLMVALGHPSLRADVISRWYARGKVSRDTQGRYRLGDILELNPTKPNYGADGV